jgi:hypothetical protein
MDSSMPRATGLVVKRRSCTRTACWRGIAALIGGGGHQGEKGVPIHQPAPGEMAGAGVQQAELVGGDEDEPRLVQAAASGAAEHLQNFIAAQELVLVVALVGFGGEGDAAEGEIDARRQPHGGDDDAQLAGLGQGFNDARAGGVAQAAVMISDAAFQHFGERLAGQGLLRGAQTEGIGNRQNAGQFGGERFGGLAVGGRK